eukprot:359985-Chlamydomonas_euryale.AAC.19
MRSSRRPWRSKIPPPALDPRVEQLIRELFELIDDDGDGSITLPKLAAALRVRWRDHGSLIRIPCPPSPLDISQ